MVRLLRYDHPHHWLTTYDWQAVCQWARRRQSKCSPTNGWRHGSNAHLLYCLWSVHIIKVKVRRHTKGCTGNIIAPCGIHWLCRQCLQCLRWLSRVSTVGSGTPWNSGSQSQPPPRGHRMWEPSPEGHKAGRLTCWCRRGRTLSCQTPGSDCFPNRQQ